MNSQATIYGNLSPQLLEQVLTAHERYVRREPGGQRAVFKFVQLSRLSLSARMLDDADFTAAAMVETLLIRTSLKRASFFGADLTLADLRAADCSRADLRGAVLRGANLAHANLNEADMRRAVLAVYEPGGGLRRWRPASNERSQASLRGSNLNAALIDEAEAAGADFSGCSLRGARLNGANLKGAVLRDAVMTGAEFRGAIMAGVDLQGAILTGVNLADMRLPPEAFTDCVCDPGPQALARRTLLVTRLNEAAVWVDSGGKRGAPPQFDNEDIRVLGDLFRNRTLPAAIARRCRGVGMDFTGAQLPGSLFDDADLRDASFAGADLRGVSFRGANLAFARFDGARLGPLEIEGRERIDTCFDGANLTGALFDQAGPQADGATEAA